MSTDVSETSISIDSSTDSSADGVSFRSDAGDENLEDSTADNGVVDTTDGCGIQFPSTIRAVNCEHVWIIRTLFDQNPNVPFHYCEEVTFCHGKTLTSKWMLKMSKAAKELDYTITMKMSGNNWENDQYVKLKLLVMKSDGQPSKYLTFRGSMYVKKDAILSEELASLTIKGPDIYGEDSAFVLDSCLQVRACIGLIVDHLLEKPRFGTYGPWHEDFSKLLTTGKWSDVTLRARDKTEYKVHRAILGAGSSVFSAMMEQNQNVLEVTDVSPEVLRKLLEYVYSGRVSEKEDVVLLEDVLAAADKYELVGVKDACERIFAARLTVDTAASMLVLADRCRAAVLKSSTMQFIFDCGKEVVGSEGWKELEDTRMDLVIDMFQYMLSLQ